MMNICILKTKKFNQNKCLEKKYELFYVHKKCFDINVMIKMPSKKCIYRFKYFSFLYIRTIGGSIDFIRVIFDVILAIGNMHIFKYKYTFVLLMQKYHLISVLLPKNLFL